MIKNNRLANFFDILLSISKLQLLESLDIYYSKVAFKTIATKFIDCQNKSYKL